MTATEGDHSAPPAKPRSRLRARINRFAAGLTHAMFVLAIALAFTRGSEPQATVKRPPDSSGRTEAAIPTAALPRLLPQPENPDTGPAAATSPDDQEFQVAARSRRNQREQKEAPPAPEPVTELPTPPRSAADQARANRLMERLVSSYPDLLTGHDDNNLIWRDGTRMGFEDGAEKSFQERLERPDVEDQFAIPYPPGEMLSDPEPDFDPGRVRNAAFFTKMYGDCRRDRDVQRRLADVVWLRNHGAKKIKMTPINGVAEKLQQISDELDALPDEFMKFLRPVAGTFNCRDIGGAGRWGAHGFGIAIDLNSAQGDYWETRGRRRGGEPEAIEYANRIPQEIVAIFEKHGFIWGGKWYHYDTAHFEYRPELLIPDEIAGGTVAVPMPVKQPRNLN
jgi:hypothetical protein